MIPSRLMHVEIRHNFFFTTLHHLDESSSSLSLFDRVEISLIMDVFLIALIYTAVSTRSVCPRRDALLFD